MDLFVTEMIITIFCILGAVALPTLIVWLNNRRRINETNQRTQIVLAAIEKNAETDVEDLLKKMAPQKKLLKEKLLSKLLLGGIIAFLGAAILGYCIIQGFIEKLRKARNNDKYSSCIHKGFSHRHLLYYSFDGEGIQC